MSEDIVKQAQLRRQRRPKTAQEQDELIFKPNQTRYQNDSDENIDTPIPSSHSNDEDFYLNLSPMGASERPRTPKYRTQSTRTDAFRDKRGVSDTILPFIRCKIYDKEVKALINTGSPLTSINKRLLEQCSSGQQLRGQVTIEIEDTHFKTDLGVNEVGPDVCLGMDFLINNRCELNLVNRTLTLDEKTTAHLLTENEIPFKYRTKASLASSI